jgi:AcrR family transcriptional regulator
VAEHRENQLRAVLDSARAILGETRSAPTLAATAERAGLARSSIYRYFTSAEELLAAVVADVFPDWAGQVRDRVEAAATPGEKVWAYVCANVDLFASSEQDVASALGEVADPQLLRQPMQAFHAELQEPLVRALEELGEPRPDLMASAIESAVVHVSRSLRQPSGPVLAKDEVLALLHRMLGGALGVPSLAGAGQPHQPSR